MYSKEFTAKDGTKFILREPRIEDAEDLMNNINSIIIEEMSGILLNKQVTFDDEKKWILEVIDDISKGKLVMLVVEVNGKVRGNCEIRKKNFKDEHGANLGTGIGKAIRDKGIGSILITETLKLAKEKLNGVEMVQLNHFEYNSRAGHVYEKIGFKKIAFLPKVIKEKEVYFGESVMQYWY